MKKILVVGSSNVDFVLRVEEMPRKGETIRAKSFEKIPGGKGANQACAVGKLGGNCRFLSVLGQDALGDMITESLTCAGVDLTHVLRVESVSTGMAMISVNDDGENSITVVPGTNALCGDAYFEKNIDLLESGDILLTQLETPQDAVYRLLKAAKQKGCTTILNPAPAPDTIPDEVMKTIDFITPNETELEKITGMPVQSLEEITAAADCLLARGAGAVIVTVGPRGALLCTQTEKRLYPTYDVPRVDTTAAGDTFNAGLAVGLAEEKSMEQIMNLANAAAAISIGRKGAQTSIPSREEVDALLNKVRRG